MKIRDLRNGEWFWVNNAVMSCPHIDSETYRVYSTLASFGGMPEIRPTIATISKKSCVSVRKVNYAIKKLLEIGFVEIKIGGGRGRSNVYNLLKAVKGCTVCSVSKPCTDEQETLHETTLNPAHGAHHKDIYKNNNKDSSEAAGEVQSTYTPLGTEVVKAFEVVDPKNKTYYNNTTQREACDFLISEYGLEEVLKRVSILPRTNKVPFFPSITTPYQLKEKWVQLQDKVEQKRGELKAKQPRVIW